MIVPSRPDPLAEAIRSDPSERLALLLYPHAVRFARRFLGGDDPHLAETAAHDAILAAVRYRHTFRGESRGSTWLYAVTRRAAVRLREREARHLADRVSLSVDAVAREAEARAAERPDPTEVADAIAELETRVPNPRWREVWLLHNDPELRLSIDEVAARTDYTPGSAAVILSRVRSLLSAAPVA